MAASLAAPYALVLAAPGPNLLVVLRASLVPSIANVFGLGLLAALSNPTSIPFFVSFFVANPGFHAFLPLACAIVFAMALVWFSTIGVLFARSTAQSFDGASALHLRHGLAFLMTGCAVVPIWKLLAV